MNLSPMSWRMFCGSLSWSARTLSLEKMASVSADTCVMVFLAVSYRALAASATLSCIKNQHITQRVSTVLQIHACILKHLIIVHRLLQCSITLVNVVFYSVINISSSMKKKKKITNRTCYMCKWLKKVHASPTCTFYQTPQFDLKCHKIPLVLQYFQSFSNLKFRKNYLIKRWVFGFKKTIQLLLLIHEKRESGKTCIYSSFRIRDWTVHH